MIQGIYEMEKGIFFNHSLLVEIINVPIEYPAKPPNKKPPMKNPILNN